MNNILSKVGIFFRVAWCSLCYRKTVVILTILSISVGVFVLLGVEHVRQQTKENFTNTVSGVDLIVGARTGAINLLLYSVFRVGNPTNNISWNSYKKISAHHQVAWSIPISLGDSHKGYRVVGTTMEYFNYFRYGRNKAIKFNEGDFFRQTFEVVLGAEVARKLRYDIGDSLIISHGIAATSFQQHENNPFKVSGILQPTGTPIDNALYVSLEAIEAIHSNWQNGVNLKENNIKKDLTPKAITAILLGLKTKMVTFQIQRDINQMKSEPLLAILPGVALTSLWRMLSMVENILKVLSILIFISALLGMIAMLLTAMRERNHELFILRTIGASPKFIILLVMLEVLLISLLAILIAMISLTLVIFFANYFFISFIGMQLEMSFLNFNSLFMLSVILFSIFLISLIPAYKAYKMTRSS